MSSSEPKIAEELGAENVRTAASAAASSGSGSNSNSSSNSDDESSASASEQQVFLSKERFIPVSKNQFLSRLCDLLSSDPKEQQLFAQLCCAIEALFHVRCIPRIEDFKRCYSYFERRNRLLSSQISRVSEHELCLKQNELLSYIFTTINDANFDAITYDMYCNSIEQVYLSDLPIVVDWPKLDSNLLTQFFRKYPELDPYRSGDADAKPPFHQHFAIFYRGYGLHTKRGLFLTPKINLIINDCQQYVLGGIALGLQFLTASLFSAKKQQQQKNDTSENTPLQQQQKQRSAESESESESEMNAVQTQRISLRDTYAMAKVNGIKSILWWFLKNIRLQEPTFRRLILVYRSLPEGLLAQQLRRAKESSQRLGKKLGAKVQKQFKKVEEKIKYDIQQTISRQKSRLESIVHKSRSNLFHTNSKESVADLNNGAEKEEKTEIVDDCENDDADDDSNDGNAPDECTVADSGAEKSQNDGQPVQKKTGIVDEIGRRRSTQLLRKPTLKTVSKSKEKSFYEPIRIQYFSDIPMADLELSYPCKRLSLKPMDKIYLFITLFLGCYAIMREIFFSTSTWVGTVTLLGCVLLMIRAITWYRNTERTYIQTVNQTLFDSSISTDKDVLLSLLDSVNEQQFMETVLAYFVLYKNNTKPTPLNILDSEAVDGLCQELMRNEFGSKMNVEIMDAMRKLSGLGLFEFDATDSRLDSIRVKSLPNAISCVHQHFIASQQSFRRLDGIHEFEISNFDLAENDENSDDSGRSEDGDRNQNQNQNNGDAYNGQDTESSKPGAVLSASDGENENRKLNAEQNQNKTSPIIVSNHFRKKSDASEDGNGFVPI